MQKSHPKQRKLQLGQPSFHEKLMWACLPTISDTHLEKLYVAQITTSYACIANKSSSLHVPPNKAMKNENNSMVAQDTLIYGMMFRTCFHDSRKLTQIMSNHQTSSNLPGKSRGILQKTPRREAHSCHIPSSLRLAVVKVKVFEPSASAKPWSAAARSAARGPLTLRLSF